MPIYITKKTRPKNLLTGLRVADMLFLMRPCYFFLIQQINIRDGCPLRLSDIKLLSESQADSEIIRTG
ncbi:MAG: hypothetical protein ACJ0G8_03930 [Dehalococcoidia bacterium]